MKKTTLITCSKHDLENRVIWRKKSTITIHFFPITWQPFWFLLFERMMFWNAEEICPLGISIWLFETTEFKMVAILVELRKVYLSTNVGHTYLYFQFCKWCYCWHWECLVVADAPNFPSLIEGSAEDTFIWSKQKLMTS